MTSIFSTKINKVKNALDNIYFKKSNIATNLATDDDTKALSAKQGKVLNDSKANLNTPIEFIIGTQTASTAAWTGVSTKISALTAGTVIFYKLPYASANANVTLNLTLTTGKTTGAKNVFFVNTTRVKQQYAVNAIICLMYDGTQWRVINPYTDKNDDHIDRNRFVTTGVLIKEAFTSDYGFICGDSEGYEKLVSGVTFDLDYPILYFGYTGDIAEGVRTTYGYTNYPSISLVWVVPDIVLELDEMVYLVGTVQGNKFTVDTEIITQSPNSTEKVYLPLGIAITATNMIFFPIYTLYHYNGSELVPYVPSHSHSEYVNPVIVDNLTTDDSSKVLSARQGKQLNDTINNLSIANNPISITDFNINDMNDYYSFTDTEYNNITTENNNYAGSLEDKNQLIITGQTNIVIGGPDETVEGYWDQYGEYVEETTYYPPRIEIQYYDGDEGGYLTCFEEDGQLGNDYRVDVSHPITIIDNILSFTDDDNIVCELDLTELNVEPMFYQSNGTYVLKMWSGGKNRNTVDFFEYYLTEISQKTLTDGFYLIPDGNEYKTYVIVNNVIIPYSLLK